MKTECNIEGCSLPSNSNEIEILVRNLKREVNKLMNETEAKLLMHDGKIAEMCLYIKNNLSNSIRDLLDSMQLSGEFEEIVVSVITSGVVDKLTEDIENLNQELENEINRVNNLFDLNDIFYDGIESQKLYDEVSKSYYYLTTIPTHDTKGRKINFKLGIANDDEKLGTLESTLNFAHRKNATLCINAGIYNTTTKYPVGILIKDGKILYNDTPSEDKYQYLAIMNNGSIKVYNRHTSATKMLNEGAKDVVCIFASLINNGVSVVQTDDRKEPRQSIGIKQDGTINIITCDGRSVDSHGMSYTDLVRLHNYYNSFNAYILDGGGSTSTVLRGVKLNENIDVFGTIDRPIATYLYISKDTNTTKSDNTGNDLGKIKNELIGLIKSRTDFYRGFIRLRGPENYFAPGIEMYINNEETRRSKIGLSFDSNNIRNTYLFLGLKAGETEKTNLLRLYDHGVWVQLYQGTSSQRPNGVKGLCYFDETLNKPIFYDGTKWIDATGTQV